MKKYLQKLDIAGLAMLIAAVIWYSASGSVWSGGNLALAVAGGIFTAVGAIVNFGRIVTSLGKRSSKYAGNYAVSLILILVIAGGLNYVGAKHLKRFDMTSVGRYTLAPQTAQVLANLDGDVRIMAFFPGGHHAPLKELLTEYSALSSRLQYEFIDPDRQNYLARQYDITSYGALRNPMTGEALRFGTVIVSLGGRLERIEKGAGGEIEEIDLTSAIIKVSRTETKKIYFLEGHGEKGIDGYDDSGYFLARTALESQGYAVDTVNLAERGAIPEDAAVLVAAGPRFDPFPLEMDLIERFLESGGGALFMIDPPPSPSMQDFFSKWGVQADDNIVLDASGAGRLMGMSESMPLVLRYEPHPITDRFNAMSFFPVTRSIRPAETVPYGIDVQPLFYSSESSWGETDLSGGDASFDPDKDLLGPLSLAVAVFREMGHAPHEPYDYEEEGEDGAAPAVSARMVVAGTSNFAIDPFFAVQGNGNLFLNMVSWLARDGDLISIRPRYVDDRRIILSQGQMAMVRVFTVLFLPGAAVAAGIAVFMRRRRM